jgi:hypothetical protein
LASAAALLVSAVPVAARKDEPDIVAVNVAGHTRRGVPWRASSDQHRQPGLAPGAAAPVADDLPGGFGAGLSVAEWVRAA